MCYTHGMYVLVTLINGFKKPLWYRIPESWPQKKYVDAILHVPLQKRTVYGLVIQQQSSLPHGILGETVREVLAVEPFPEDRYFLPFIKKVAYAYQVPEGSFIRRIRAYLDETGLEEKITSFFDKEENFGIDNVQLTEEQQKVTDFVSNCLQKKTFEPTVLHGVTGSGKTEVYKALIKAAFDQGKTSILLLPEVSLALAFEKKLRDSLPNQIEICGFHSGKSVLEKRELWRNLLNKKRMLIIGVHLPILLPVSQLGLIIVDEEHDPNYREKQAPYIHTREAALLRAKTAQIPILFGSATPSLQTLYRVKTEKFHFFQLKERFSGIFPHIRFVSLINREKRPNFWLSKELIALIKDRLLKKEQTIIFLNRRGFSFFVQCSLCSFIFSCSNCSVSLTLHENGQLMCHYCGAVKQMPHACFECQADETCFLKRGIGTQQVASLLQKLFPNASIARADLDVTAKKKGWQKTCADFYEGKIDILVGTQTITKGYHFPRVTLIGILWADMQLHFPLYSAAEMTLQQLIQVAGRAGREGLASDVVVQAMVEHPLFSLVNEVDYLKLYVREIELRKQLSYPPITYLIEIDFKNSKEKNIDVESVKFAHQLREVALQEDAEVTVLGPAKPPVHQIKKQFLRKIFMKVTSLQVGIAIFQRAQKMGSYTSLISFIPSHL